MDSFLPNDYKVPQTGGYMKFQDGDNTFRILSSAIIGYEYWTPANKPVRMKQLPASLPTDIKLDKEGKPTSIKHFWAFVVWNYEADMVQILEVTQRTVMDGIKALVDNKKWGDPKGYDIMVSRSGGGLDTEYSVVPSPHTDVPESVKKAYAAKKVNLEALFDSGDPFAGK